MKHFFSLILFATILFIGDYAAAFSDKTSSKNDVEIQFIILEFPKYEKVKIQQLLSELHSYSGKIYDAQFDYVTHHLNISYYTTIKLDDILEVVSKYDMDFTKFSGSELE
jgi:NADH:ubiquinone oxidoreductase subunit E